MDFYAVLDQVVRRADGVPLFVEEVTRMLTEAGAFVEHPDQIALPGCSLYSCGAT